ncbi:putative HTH-type transcriptional regulator YvaP [Philodulcilactobacillus myokoensis]|uniref:HTH-type transcriptional regulator YvaP n=1 Tax=Philodulcilactobacillus myokoensis TaxID=2929573 RepID=A0A9W6AZD9_9LACO|nr:helix-turn-helix domain-containing protein [Philodulcilactobacillus myokoensis]GLB46152.1 putative HTH-type transcriptional regulator YvaP [Philodulcilactobacillus myokoensis]
MQKNQTNDCPIQPFIEIISGKWSAIVLWEIYNGNNHYGKLKRSIPGISTRTLSLRLRKLETKNILERHILDNNPPTVKYTFTAKGKALAPILYQMKNWSMKYNQ